MIIEKSDQVKDDNGWCSLPTLLLWTIKARLDYHNSVRFSLVCKHWKHAVQSYPPRFMDEVEIPHLRPTEYKRSRLARNRRTVNRAYGGVLSGGAIRERITRAFLVEEQKIVKKVLKIQKTKEKLSAKA